MSEVKCYLCGRNYQPTAEASTNHTHHAQAVVRPSVESITRDLEACQAERDSALRLPRIIDLDYLEEIADIMAKRMELAVVQRVPRELVELFDDNVLAVIELRYGVRPPSQVILKYVRRGDVLELEFWVNGSYRVATFRFQST